MNSTTWIRICNKNDVIPEETASEYNGSDNMCVN